MSKAQRPVEMHLIQVDDDLAQQAAICSHGDFRYVSTDRNAKMAASYQHLADVLGGGTGA